MLDSNEEVMVDFFELMKMLRSHGRWLDGLRSGERLVLRDIDIAELKRDVMNLDRSELVDVSFHRCRFESVGVEYIRMENIRVKDCYWKLSFFDGAEIHNLFFEPDCMLGQLGFRKGAHWHGGCFQSTAVLCNWSGGNTLIRKVDFTGAKLYGCGFFEGLVVQDCDFRRVEWLGLQSRQTERVDCCMWSLNTWKQCDFRGGNFEHLDLNGTTLRGCALHGIQGAPVLLDATGTTQLIDCDLSPNFDGSMIVSHEEALEYLLNPDVR